MESEGEVEREGRDGLEGMIKEGVVRECGIW